jgi:hypothetical protein
MPFLDFHLLCLLPQFLSLLIGIKICASRFPEIKIKVVAQFLPPGVPHTWLSTQPGSCSDWQCVFPHQALPLWGSGQEDHGSGRNNKSFFRLGDSPILYIQEGLSSRGALVTNEDWDSASIKIMPSSKQAWSFHVGS